MAILTSSENAFNLNQYLEEAIALARVEDIYSWDGHKFKESSGKMRGYCPFHESKSGTSFTVSLHNKLWFCGGCNVGGGPLQYIEGLRHGSPGVRLRGKNFVDAVKDFCSSQGVLVPDMHLDEEQLKKAERWHRKQFVLGNAIEVLQDYLWTENGEKARAYCHSRGYSDDGIKNLGLGLFPPMDEFVKSMEKKGISEGELRECGFFAEKPPLPGYIAHPWLNSHGQPLTIYFRWQEKEHPEGLTKTTALGGIDTKHSPLYLDRALRSRKQEIIAVEGVNDAGLLQTKGIDNIVAYVGASFSNKQIDRLVKDRIQKVILIPDPDAGGANGTRSNIERLLERGITVFVANLPDGKDPDEYVVEYGLEAFADLVENAVHGLKWLASYLVQKNPGNDQGRATTLQEAKRYAEQFSALKDDLDLFFWPLMKSVIGGGEVIDIGVEISDELDPVETLKKLIRSYIPKDEVLDKVSEWGQITPEPIDSLKAWIETDFTVIAKDFTTKIGLGVEMVATVAIPVCDKMGIDQLAKMIALKTGNRIDDIRRIFNALRPKDEQSSVDKTQAKLQHIRKQFPDLAFNELSRKVENNGEAWEDLEHAYLLPEISSFSDAIGKEFAVDAIRHLAGKNAYHPVKQYLEGLDGGEQLTDDEWNNIASLLLGANDELDQIIIRKFLISAVARIYQPGCYVRMMPVLKGDQNIGKSTFFKLLAGDDFFCDSLGNLDNIKDDYITLHSAWIHEWGELDKLNKKSAGEVKAFVTKTKDDFRAPYDRSNKTYLRRCVIVGTCNRGDFLQDATGNTRYAVIKVEAFDLGKVKELRDKIWATARAKYLAGESWELTKAEQALSELNNTGYTDIDVWTPKIERFLSTGITAITLDRILGDCLNIDVAKQGTLDAKRVRNILGQLGWVRDKNATWQPDGTRQRVWRPEWTLPSGSPPTQTPDTESVSSVSPVSGIVSDESLATKGFQVCDTTDTVKNQINYRITEDEVQKSTQATTNQESPPSPPLSVETPLKTVIFAVSSVSGEQNPCHDWIPSDTEPGTNLAQTPDTGSVPAIPTDKNGVPLAVGDKVRGVGGKRFTVEGFRCDERGLVVDCREVNPGKKPSPKEPSAPHYWYECEKVAG